MSTTTVIWQEVISRGAAVALMHNFTSVSEALKELVDNAVDFMWNQPLKIEIMHDKRFNRVVIESDGGRGMGAEEIQDWLNWGEGEEHPTSHIGMYHQGGKAACGFLGQRLRLWAKRAGSDDVWLITDQDWSTRKTPKNFGQPKPVPRTQWPPTMQSLETDRRHVRIELSKLVKARRWNLETLKRVLSSTYRDLIETGKVQIEIGGEQVAPLHIPISTATEEIKIHVDLKGKSVSGWAGRMKRDQIKATVKSGLRLLHNGRVIKDGEWFGYNHEGKGALNSLVGELKMSGFTPIPNKTDFVEVGDHIWEELGAKVRAQLTPLISELRRSGQDVRVTRKEKDNVREVADELKEVFESLVDKPELKTPLGAKSEPREVDAGGRKPPEPRQEAETDTRNPRGPNPNPSQPRTSPPDNPVGNLVRLLDSVLEGTSRLPLRVKGMDSSERSSWELEGGKTWLNINNLYHLYLSLEGAKPYLAETAILQVCKPQEGESLQAGEYIERVNLMLIKWAQVADIDGTEGPD